MLYSDAIKIGEKSVGAFEMHTKGTGSEIMRKYGWKPGNTLGAGKMEGLMSPIQTSGRHSADKSGLGYEKFFVIPSKTAKKREIRANEQIETSNRYDVLRTDDYQEQMPTEQHTILPLMKNMKRKIADLDESEDYAMGGKAKSRESSRQASNQKTEESTKQEIKAEANMGQGIDAEADMDGATIRGTAPNNKLPPGARPKVAKDAKHGGASTRNEREKSKERDGSIDAKHGGEGFPRGTVGTSGKLPLGRKGDKKSPDSDKWTDELIADGRLNDKQTRNQGKEEMTKKIENEMKGPQYGTWHGTGIERIDE